MRAEAEGDGRARAALRDERATEPDAAEGNFKEADSETAPAKARRDLARAQISVGIEAHEDG